MMADKKIYQNSNPAPLVPPLSEELLDEYIDFIQKRFGIIAKKNNRELVKAIHDECNKLQMHPSVFLAGLKQADDYSELLNHLIAIITIGETYFFRDKQQTKLLSEVILPEIIRSKISAGSKSIRIWSAGCSSGEEIYTIAMLLSEAIKDLSTWNCYLLATDINIENLRKGMAGGFGEWSMRSIPPQYLNKYFIKNDNTYELVADIKKLVTFDYLNLNSESYPSILSGTTSQDLIICRNVLIYFDMEHAAEILQRLSMCLADDGCLMLGASDPVAISNLNLIPAYGSTSTFLRDNNIHIDRVADLMRLDNSVSNNNAHGAVTSEVTPEIGNVTSQIMMLANNGKTQEAIVACENYLKIDKMNKEIYFIYALALAEEGRVVEAESSFKKALYLDPDYLLCSYQFGLFLIHLKRSGEGMKSLQNTMTIARKSSPDALVPGLHNIKYEELINILEHETELHQSFKLRT